MVMLSSQFFLSISLVISWIMFDLAKSFIRMVIGIGAVDENHVSFPFLIMNLNQLSFINIIILF